MFLIQKWLKKQGGLCYSGAKPSMVDSAIVVEKRADGTNETERKMPSWKLFCELLLYVSGNRWSTDRNKGKCIIGWEMAAIYMLGK